MVWPIFIVVSVKPSVSLQSVGHLDRSMLNPLGPVKVLPSADLPNFSSWMRLMIAARCVAQSASHSSIVCGCPAAVVLVAPAAVVVEDVAPPSVAVVGGALDESSPPQAAANSATP